MIDMVIVIQWLRTPITAALLPLVLAFYIPAAQSSLSIALRCRSRRSVSLIAPLVARVVFFLGFLYPSWVLGSVAFFALVIAVPMPLAIAPLGFKSPFVMLFPVSSLLCKDFGFMPLVVSSLNARLFFSVFCAPFTLLSQVVLMSLKAPFLITAAAALFTGAERLSIVVGIELREGFFLLAFKAKIQAIRIRHFSTSFMLARCGVCSQGGNENRLFGSRSLDYRLNYTVRGGI